MTSIMNLPATYFVSEFKVYKTVNGVKSIVKQSFDLEVDDEVISTHCTKQEAEKAAREHYASQGNI